MSTITADAVHLDEDAITVARFVVSLQAETGGFDCNDWPATVQLLNAQRRWAEIADVLDGRPVPVDVAELLLPFVAELRDEAILQLEIDKESRQRVLDGDADYGRPGDTIEQNLAMYDRLHEQSTRDVAGCDRFIAAFREVTA